MDRVADRAIAGAAALWVLEAARQIGALPLIERRNCHDHSGGAEPALKRLRIEKGFLHRVQPAVGGEARNRRHPMARGAEGRHQAGMYRNVVEPYCAGAAITGIASFLDPEGSELA